MKTAKTLVAVAGLVMLTGSALAQRVDEDDLLGTWDCLLEGPRGEATARIVMVENGTYLSVAIAETDGEPLSYWEVGEWEVDGDEITFTPTGVSEGASMEVEIATVEDLDDGVLVLSSDKIGELEFEWVADPIVGVWQAETDEGTATFAMSCDGGFAGTLGEGREAETFWGTWEQDDDTIAFSATEEGWSPDGGGDFEEHEGQVGDVDETTLSMSIEGLSDGEIEWERVAAHPLIGEWTGVVDGGSEVTFVIDEEGTFDISMEGEAQTFGGVWTVAGGHLVLGMMFEGGGGVEVLRYALTSPDTVMLGQEGEMEEFTRE